MNILVTGANGFVGKHLCLALQFAGHQVSASTSRDLDITKPFKMSGHYDYVFHLAAYNITSVGDQNEAMYERVNVQGTKHVLEGIASDHFVFLSTSRIYEHSLSGYAKSKLAAESICQEYFKGKGLIILRSANILGKGQAPKAVLPVFLERAMQNQALVIMGNPALSMTYVDVRDIVELSMAILKHSQCRGVYNVAYPKSVTLKELALKVIAATHSSSTINQSAPEAPSSIEHMDCQRTWDDFGFMPQHDIDQIIESII